MSALDTALGITKAARSAATVGMSDDPMLGRLQGEQAKTDAARAQAATAVQSNMQAKADILASPPPPNPSIPRLHELPEAPPVPEKKDPLRVFGQFLPVMAALGALTTRQPAVNALNAATAAIGAADKQDKEALAKAHQQWLDQTQVAIQDNNRLSQEYNLALGDRNLTMADRMAKVQALAAASQDALVLAQLRSGNIEGVAKLIEMRDSGAKQLTDVVKDVQDTNLRQEENASQAAHRLAEEDIANRRLIIDGQNVSMGEAIGPILRKMAVGGTLTAGEKAAVAQYKDLGGSRSGFPELPPAPSDEKTPPSPPKVDVPARADGVYLPKSVGDMAKLPKGAQYVNPATLTVFTKRE